jgi:hypothetical protein
MAIAARNNLLQWVSIYSVRLQPRYRKYWYDGPNAQLN